eukprot:2028304-Amphidinium_carterae.1
MKSATLPESSCPKGTAASEPDYSSRHAGALRCCKRVENNEECAILLCKVDTFGFDGARRCRDYRQRPMLDMHRINTISSEIVWSIAPCIALVEAALFESGAYVNTVKTLSRGYSLYLNIHAST